jgi:hypothetical protein
MAAKAWSGSAALACLAGVAMLGFTSTACALDAYWAGLRSNDWSDGLDPINQVSNWYHDPASQVPANVPDGTAIFAGMSGLLPPDVVGYVEIEKIRFQPGAALVAIGIANTANLVVKAGGISNQSAVTPLFHVAGVIEFRGSARLTSASARSAFFRLIAGAPLGTLVLFRDDSKGGDASVETLHAHTYVQFVDRASAQNMEIANRFGKVDFFNRSTGGNAELVNHLHGRVDFDSIGPQPDGIVTIGAIRNDGVMIISNRTNLVVQRNLVLDAFAQGKVKFEVLGKNSGRATRAGNIVVHGKTRLGGDLIVDADSSGVTRGSHRLIKAMGGLTGRFRTHSLKNFPPTMRPRIVYAGKSVFLVIE